MLVSINNATKYFGDKLILSGISAAIEDTDRIGLIGANGIGKSTLLHLINGKLDPDEGSVDVSNRVTVGTLEQNSGLDRSNTIYEEMRSVFSSLLTVEMQMRTLEREIAASTLHDETYQHKCEEYSRLTADFESREGYQIDVKIKTVLNGMGFEDKSYDLDIAALSGGEKTRLALAKLLLEQPDLLILDEPTNHLDFRSLTWLEEYLSGYKGGLLVVSHDRYFLDKMVTKTWEIENKKLFAYPGNYTKYKHLRAERIKREMKEYEAQQNRINSMREYAERNIARATTSNMAKSRLHQLEHIEVLEKPVDRIPTPHFRFEFDRNPVKDLLTVKDLRLTVGEGNGKVTLAEHLSFEIKRGEKVALIGPNGVGKSTLLKTVLGYLPADGEIYWGNYVKTSYYEQENQTLNPNNTALSELWGRFPLMQEYKVRGILGQVLISGDNAFKPIGVLSGGERARIALAVIMTERSNTLLLDEPTNHLDLQSKEQLEDALVQFEGTLLFVSHDRYFLNTIPDKIIELSRSGLRIYPGNYDEYLESKRREMLAAAETPAAKKPEAEKKSNYRSKQERAEQAKMRARISKLEQEIEICSERIRTLEEEIASPALASDYARLTECCTALEEEKSRHDALFEEWAVLSENFSS
jgi:ATP-binding cassette subfamily F protein 3